MRRHSNIRAALTAATAALVGAVSATAAGLSRSETSFLVYSERQRVQAREAMFSLDRQLNNGNRLNFRFTYDGLTGASPTGASPSKRPQTLTRPSGGTTTVVGAGEFPIDDSFGDTRFAAELGYSGSLGSRTTGSAGVRVSSEHDYHSYGLSGGLNRSLAEGKANVGLLVTIAYDRINPLGGVPSPMESTTTVAIDEYGRRVGNGKRTKQVFDLAVSYDRVLSPTAIGRINISLNRASGYLTDPYKVISVVQPPDSTDAGEPMYQLFERRPAARTGGAIGASVRKLVLGTIVESGYRFFLDDWGVTSHTLSTSIKYDLGRTGALEPRARWYHQNRARFSRPFLVDGAPRPNFVSADARLADFDAFSYGLTYSVPTSRSSRLVLSADFYTQRGDRSPPESFGPLLDIGLFPDLNALMLRVGLIHEF